MPSLVSGGPLTRPRHSSRSWIVLAYLPVPCNGTLCGLPGALSVNDSEPVRSPVCVGVKLTFSLQLAPAANVLPHCFATGFSAKSPLMAMFEMFRVETPVFLRVTALQHTFVPTRCFPVHVNEVGVRVTTGPVAVTVSCTVV